MSCMTSGFGSHMEERKMKKTGLIIMVLVALSMFATGCGNKYTPNKGDGGHCAICGKGPCTSVPYNDSYYCLEHYAEAYYHFENQ